MSEFKPTLVPTGDPVTTGIFSAIATGARSFLPDLLGNGGGPNVARSLSKQVGFKVLQSDAVAVRARLAAGLDPRTGRPVSNRSVLATPGATTGTKFSFGSLFRNLVSSGAQQIIASAPAPIRQVLAPVAQQLLPGEVGIRRGGLPAGFPVPSIKTLQTPALPRRQMVPPGGGRVSLLPAAGMASVGAIARMGARGLVRTSTGRISRIVLPSGQSFSRKQAASLIRRVGFEAAAIALGIGIVEAAELLLTDSKSRSRGRGISAAQVRNARRTTCAVARLARDLGIKAAPARRRKATCR